MASTYPRLVRSLIHLAVVSLFVCPINPRAQAGVGLWPSDAEPAVEDAGPDGPVELGMRFHSDVDGVINGIRFYKGPTNLGAHTVNLWSSSGDLLATAVSNSESSGWQQINFASAVTVAANTDYVVSYFCPLGHFSVTRDYFTADINRGPLHARSASESGNGVYRYSAASTFPTDTYDESNYWVDVDFEANPPGDVTKIVISAASPALSIGGSIQLSAAAIYSNQSKRDITEEVNWSSSVADCATIDVTGRATGIAIGSTTITAEFGALSAVATVAVQLPPIPGSNIWPSGAMPVVMDAGPDNPVELGVKFRSEVSGKVRGVRFYKSIRNTGLHLGSLWTSSGTLLGMATFADETASGWQDATFVSPIAIEAGTTYVASYFCPAGHFSVTRDYFATSGSEPSSPLRALADRAVGGNGVFKYGPNSAFPTDAYNASHYWVDVDFVADPQGELTGIVVGEANSSLVVGKTKQFNARAVYTNGSSEEITDQVTWTSSDVGIATIDASGTATGVSVGTGVLSATFLGVSGSTTLNVQVAPPPSFSIWPLSSAPEVMDAGPDQAVELGVKFKSTVNGKIWGIRFYKHAANSGPHVGSLWSSTGELLGTAAFADETESGWQEANFASPVPIVGNTVYVASYFCPSGHFSVTRNYFESGTVAAIPDSPLQFLTDAEGNGNGVYLYGPTGGFPANTYSSSNYWVDVNYEADEPGPVTSIVVRPAVAKLSIGTTQQFTALSVYSNGSTVDVTDQVTWTSSDPSRATVNADGLVAGLSGGLVTIAADLAGLSGSLDLEVGLAPVPGLHIWLSSTEPATVDVGPDNPVELGVKFRADRAGMVRGIRFYKASTNTGTHIANLWSSTGTLLATATFAVESASGWQEATFSTPVMIEAGTVYVASYFCPRGHFSVSRDYFATSGFGSSPLYAFAAGEVNGNGVFKYGSGSAFPTETYASSNYWVDVDFEPASVRALASISLAPQNAVVSTGGKQQFTATGVYSDGTTADLTEEVVWSSSLPATATIDSGGLAAGAGIGTASIAVSFGSISVSTTLTVTPPAASITSDGTAIGRLGSAFSYQITATNTPSSYSASGLPAGLTINTVTGVISGTPTGPGKSVVTIGATNAEEMLSTTLTITIRVPLPYIADFERERGYLIGNLNGQLGWEVEQGTATVTADDAVNGMQSIQLSDGNSPTVVVQSFAEDFGGMIEYVDFYVKLAAQNDFSDSTTFTVGGAKFAFKLNGSEANLQVFHGNSSNGGFWSSTAFVLPVDSANQVEGWIRLTARLDLIDQTWDLYAFGEIVAADVPVMAPNPYLSTFRLYGPIGALVRLDDIYVGPANPLFEDLNNNGIDDTWETRYGLSLTADNRDISPTGNGITVIEAYLQGMDPNDVFYGKAPTLMLLGGNNQLTLAGEFNRSSFDVAVWNSTEMVPFVNAPVTFSVLGGEGLLATTRNGDPQELVSDLTVHTDIDGTAQVFYKQPSLGGIVSLVTASSGTATDVTFWTESFNDTDLDEMADFWEENWFGDQSQSAMDDADQDGLSNLQEFIADTDPTGVDTDGDGINDAADPLPLDFYNGVVAVVTILNDGKGGSPGELTSEPFELRITSPSGEPFRNAPVYSYPRFGGGALVESTALEAELFELLVQLTNEDGIVRFWYKHPQGLRIESEIQVLAGAARPILTAVSIPPDTDGDGLFDAQELGGNYAGAPDTYPSSPTEYSSSGGRTSDAWVFAHGYTLSEYSDIADPDDDGLDNYGESVQGTDPHDPDTDNDGVPDGGSSPRWIMIRLPFEGGEYFAAGANAVFFSEGGYWKRWRAGAVEQLGAYIVPSSSPGHKGPNSGLNVGARRVYGANGDALLGERTSEWWKDDERWQVNIDVVNKWRITGEVSPFHLERYTGFTDYGVWDGILNWDESLIEWGSIDYSGRVWLETIVGLDPYISHGYDMGYWRRRGLISVQPDGSRLSTPLHGGYSFRGINRHGVYIGTSNSTPPAYYVGGSQVSYEPLFINDSGSVLAADGIHFPNGNIDPRPADSINSNLWLDSSSRPRGYKNGKPVVWTKTGSEPVTYRRMDYMPVVLPDGWTTDHRIAPGETEVQLGQATKDNVTTAFLLYRGGLRIDANRDGIVSDLPSDLTSAQTPFRFWLNDDDDAEFDQNTPIYDEREQDDRLVGGINKPDFEDESVDSERDLEDFARLWIHTEGLTSSFQSGDLKLGLKWTETNGTAPSIRLFKAVEADGGAGYLFDESIALQQAVWTQRAYHDPLTSRGLVEGTTTLVLPKELFSNLTEDQPKTYLLFEACTEGEGRLKLLILDKNGAEIGEGLGVWMELLRPHKFSERFTCEEASGGMVSGSVTMDFESGPLFAAPTNDEEKDYVLYVHGYNMEPFEKQRWLETTYKRLYWLGYRGRVGGLSWPCTFGAIGQVFFDVSERRAWESGARLNEHIQSLNARGYRVHLVAHSQGNVLAGEALRLWRATGNSTPLVRTYIASQAAIPAASYNPNAPRMPNYDKTIVAGVSTNRDPLPPDVYARYWRTADDERLPIAWPTSNPSYFSDTFMTSAAGRWANFYNVSDYALTGGSFDHPGWEIGQRQKPTEWLNESLLHSYGYSHLNGFRKTFGPPGTTIVWSNMRFPDDRYEIFSYGAGTWSLALGTIPTGGVFSSFTNLQSTYQYGSEHRWHSGQFRSFNAARYQYWSAVLDAALILRTNP